MNDVERAATDKAIARANDRVAHLARENTRLRRENDRLRAEARRHREQTRQRPRPAGQQ